MTAESLAHRRAQGTFSPSAAAHRVWTEARRSPGTLIYAGVLALTSFTLQLVSRTTADTLLERQSTNLHNMLIHPVQSLVASAFWIEDAHWLHWALLFALVMVPVERWLGTKRWLGLFVAGHVVATLITVGAIWHTTGGGATDVALTHVIDVGVSYGFYAVAAVLVYRLPRRWWVPAGALLIAELGWSALGGSFVDAGHIIAAAVGFAAYPLVPRVAAGL